MIIMCLRLHALERLQRAIIIIIIIILIIILRRRCGLWLAAVFGSYNATYDYGI